MCKASGFNLQYHKYRERKRREGGKKLNPFLSEDLFPMKVASPARV
jgi:hypothetical protein